LTSAGERRRLSQSEPAAAVFGVRSIAAKRSQYSKWSRENRPPLPRRRMSDFSHTKTIDPKLRSESNIAATAEPVMAREKWIGLSCHPSVRPQAVKALHVLVRRSERDLQIAFRLDGDISRIWLSSPRAPGADSQLWLHTCFETFIAVENQPAYHEFNFAPSGEWAVSAFRDYRDGGPLSNELMRPHITTRSSGNRLELDALVRLDLLSAVHARAPLRIGVSAVIETGDGLSYWALRHSRDKPDFHDADGFVLLLAPPGRKP
jgi:hypothetical protein